MLLRELAFSDLYICADPEPGEDQWITWFRPRAGEPYRVVQPVPAGCETDIDGLRKALKAHSGSLFALDYGGVRYRVSQIPDVHDEWYALRRCVDHAPRLESLGVPPKMAQDFVSISDQPGLTLISGPPGSGKTSVASALLHGFLEAKGDVAVTVENPPEAPLSGRLGNGLCYQIKVVDGDWASALEGVPRYAAAYLMIGQIGLPEVAFQAMKAVQLGMRVIATITTNEIEDAILSIASLANRHEEGADLMLSNTLNAVIQVSLERRLAVRPLMIPESTTDGIRSLIRSRKYDQLRTSIQQQQEQRFGSARLRG